MKTMEQKPPTPGSHHPAVEWVADYLPHDRPYLNVIAPITPKVDYLVDPTEPAFTRLVFTAKRAVASLLPRYGYYVWTVWVDQHGRFVTDPEAVWQAHPEAEFLPTWNPVVTPAH